MGLFSAVFPIALVQFDVDQFRPPGWFCAGIGVLLLLLQLAVFRGECVRTTDGKSSNTSVRRTWKMLRSGELKFSSLFCTVGVSLTNYTHHIEAPLRICVFVLTSSKIPLYILLVGGVKGARYVIPDMLLSPILADSFGLSGEYISYFFLSVLGSIIGTLIV